MNTNPVAATEPNLHIKQFLEAGVHFGHRTSRWNPRMRRYIFMKRKGVHIIDLQKTYLFFDRAYNYVRNIAANGGEILFVGTKKQARSCIEQYAKKTGQHFITTRWIGGLLTNFDTVSKSIHKLIQLNKALADTENPIWQTKKEMTKMEKKRNKLQEVFSGVVNMKKLPDLLFVVDALYERNAIAEANLMKIPICAMVDTNSDPTNVNAVIPANDDAIRSINLFVSKIATAAQEGKSRHEDNLRQEEIFRKEGNDLEELENFDVDSADTPTPPHTPEKMNAPQENKKQAAAPKKEIATPNTQGNAMDVKASVVKELREITNIGMMECKKALVEAKGNKEKAMQLLKERGIVVAAKRSDRQTKEGKISISPKNDGDSQKLALIQLACETDFVANTDNFKQTLDKILQEYLLQGEPFLKSDALAALLNDASAKTGEKIQVSQALIWNATHNETIASYLHSNSKIGVMVKFVADAAAALKKPEFQSLAKDVAMQIAAMNPLALSPDDVSQENKEIQKQLFLKQMESDKKPDAIKEKIVEGKLAKFFSENCLLNMPFVKDPKVSMQDLLHQTSKKIDSSLKILDYHRSQVG